MRILPITVLVGSGLPAVAPTQPHISGIFNPITQASKFDPNGDFVRKYVPEIANLPDTYLFSPWAAPADTLSAAGVHLGEKLSASNC